MILILVLRCLQQCFLMSVFERAVMEFERGAKTEFATVLSPTRNVCYEHFYGQ